MEGRMSKMTTAPLSKPRRNYPSFVSKSRSSSSESLSNSSTAEKSISNTSLKNNHSHGNMGSSGTSSRRSCDRSKLTRPLPKNRISMSSASSLTSLHNSSIGSGTISSSNSINSINSSSSMMRQGRYMRRQHSRSFDHVRDSLQKSRKENSTSSLRKNATFESVTSLRKRTSSGSGFSRASSNGSCHSSSNNSSTNNFSWSSKGIVQMAQRSNGSTVKGVIDELQRIVDETLAMAINDANVLDKVDSQEEARERPTTGEEEGDTEEEEEEEENDEDAPILQCSMLAQWALADSYYKVVITKYHGIPVIIRTMKAFPDDEDIQGTSCNILNSLTNKVQVYQNGGVNSFINAMKSHPNSIVVQSAAMEGLYGLMPLLLHLEEDNKDILSDIESMVKLAEDMYLTEAGSKALKELLVQLAKENLRS
ncbi:MAG: hypothetical protein SGILL_005582 [Bacillariaceae sp.]